jgi:hypothetical protein
MDDRWFAFAEESTVYMHRSWTGMGVFRAEFEQTDKGWVIARAVAQRDLDDSEMLEMVVGVILDGPTDDD